MVAMVEIVFLVVVAVVGVWWFRRTKLYRARKRDAGVSGWTSDGTKDSEFKGFWGPPPSAGG